MNDIAAVLKGKGSEVATIGKDATLAKAAAQLVARQIGALVVLEAGRLVGIISERDIVHCFARHGADVIGQNVDSAMTSEVVTARPDTPILAALAVMTSRRIRHLPVTTGDSLVGIVSIGDLVKHRMERIEAEAEALRGYIQSV